MSVTLRIGGVPEHFNFPWKLALADDAFAKVGVKVKYSEYPGGTGSLTQALKNRALDLALVLTEGGVANVVNQGHSRLAKVYVRSPLIWGIHVAGDSDIRRIGQIRNRRFAISRYGSGSHLMAVVDAAERGWSSQDMKFLVVKNLAGACDALRRGQADIFLWERFMTQPLVDHGVFRRVGQRVAPWPGFSVCVRCTVLNRQAAAVRRVLDIVANYGKRLQRRPAAARLIADTYGLKLKDARTWLGTVKWAGGYRPPVQALGRVIDSLARIGAIPDTHVSVEDVWHWL